MKQMLTVVGAALLVVGALLVTSTWPGRSNALSLESDGRVAAGRAVEEGYPPPPPPPPTPTTEPDESGYLVPPVHVSTTVTSLVDSPHSALLAPLQRELAARRADALAARVSEDRYLLDLFDVSWLDGEGGATLGRADVRALLSQFFRQGTTALVQGYFETDDRCLAVLLHPFQGVVPHPTREADFGPEPPADVPLPAASWTLCRGAPTEWIWSEWVYGAYDDLVEAYAGPPGPERRIYHVVRP